MNSERCYRHVGYEQGFDDGKRTKGRIKKIYIEMLFETETQKLSDQESQLYRTGWQDGFTDAVRVSIKNMALQGDCSIKHLGTMYDIG